METNLSETSATCIDFTDLSENLSDRPELYDVRTVTGTYDLQDYLSLADSEYGFTRLRSPIQKLYSSAITIEKENGIPIRTVRLSLMSYVETIKEISSNNHLNLDITAARIGRILNDLAKRASQEYTAFLQTGLSSNRLSKYREKKVDLTRQVFIQVSFDATAFPSSLPLS